MSDVLSNSSRPSGWALSADPESRNRLIVAIIGVGIVIYAYFLYPSCMARQQPVSIFRWLQGYWASGADYAHGYVVPLVSIGVVIWKWKKKLQALPMETAVAGLGMVAAGLLLYWIGVRAANPRVIAGSLSFLLWGLVWYLAGWKWAKELWFPCAFLFFMIPLTFLDQHIAFPLRMFVSTVSVKILNLFGMDVLQDGTAIKSMKGRFETLDVADPCSGIRSLVALMALTSIYGYVTMDRGWKKWVLFLSSMPLAVIGNLARIITITFVAQGFGLDAQKLFHDYSGFIVFSLAILCMLALGSALNFHFRHFIHYWTQEEVAPAKRPAR